MNSDRVRLDLDPLEGYDALGMLPYFLKTTADILSSRHSVVFRRPFVWVVFQLPGEKPMYHYSDELTLVSGCKFSTMSITHVLSKVPDMICFWNAEVCFKPPSSPKKER